MVIAVLSQNVFGARLRIRVDRLDGCEVKRTVRTAEIRGQLTVVGTADVVIAGLALDAVRTDIIAVRTRFGGHTVATADGYIHRGGQGRFIIDLPNVVQRNMRLVVAVVVRTFLLAFAVVAVCRVIGAIVTAVGHVFLYVVPFSESQRTRTAGRTLPVPLRSTETGERQLVLVIDTLGYVCEIAVTAVTGSLNVTVTPGLGA